MSQRTDNMTARITRLQPFVPALEFILSTFTASSSRFHRVATLDATATWPGLSSSRSAAKASQIPMLRRSRGAQDKQRQNETLIVLDASFNPPSNAHAALALAAISRHRQQQQPGGADSMHRPCRLLLLLGTKNADKHAAVPAAHAQRLAMLILFATDLRDTLAQTVQKPANTIADDSEDDEDAERDQDVPIDIGLASIPYMADKAEAIETEQLPTCASDTKQVHVMGYDTIIRVLAPRYYVDKFSPPLSALEPLFGRGHEALVVLRPTSSSDAGGEEERHAQQVQEQRAEVQQLVGGALDRDGFRMEWRGLVDTMECSDAADISSTMVRAAAEKHDYKVVNSMCTLSVAAWIREQALYDKVEDQNDESS